MINSIFNSNNTVAQTLCDLFANNAAGVDFKSAHDNMLSAVYFARNESIHSNYILIGNEAALPHCIKQFEALVEKLQEASNEQSMHANRLLQELKYEPHFSRLINFYQVIINNWDILKNRSITYRLLADLVKLQVDFTNSSEAQSELLQIIESMNSH